MVALYREGRRSVTEDLDLTRCARLDPERRALGSGVAEKWTQDKRGAGRPLQAGQTPLGTQTVTACGSTFTSNELTFTRSPPSSS